MFGRVVGKSREAVAQAMVLEMFREEDYNNDDVLDQRLPGSTTDTKKTQAEGGLAA